ncbi:MAG: hypothetical protein WCE68_00445 [Anaerolineales bacterium]
MRRRMTYRHIRNFFIVLIVLLIGGAAPVLQQTRCKAGCGPNDSYCASQCCYGTTVVDVVTSCTTYAGGYCGTNYTQNSYSCPSPGCKLQLDAGACSYTGGYCQIVSNVKVTGCCKAGGPPATSTPKPNPTHTPTQTATVTPSITPTRTPTSTPVATATSTPTATPTPLHLAAMLIPAHSSLVLMASTLHQPAQTLEGTIAGGTLPYTATLYVTRPDGTQLQYNLLSPGASFSFGPAESGDANFGTNQAGTWSARFTVKDGRGLSVSSNIAIWNVAFYPVHETP